MIQLACELALGPALVGASTIACGFLVFCAVVGLLIVSAGTAITFAAATVAAVGLQAIAPAGARASRRPATRPT